MIDHDHDHSIGIGVGIGPAPPLSRARRVTRPTRTPNATQFTRATGPNRATQRLPAPGSAEIHHTALPIGLTN